MRGLMGTFAIMPLKDLVEFLDRRRLSGSLTCERGTVRKTLHLAEGVAVGAASNDPREYLGQLLLTFGHIDEHQLAKAFQVQQETQVRLGKVLCMAGITRPEVIRDTLAIKIRETLLDVFMWDSGMFVVEDAAPPERDELDAALPLAEISQEAEFRATAWSAMRAAFPSGAAALLVDEARAPASLPPGGVDARLLACAREGKTIDEIGLALHATHFHLYQRLYAWHRQGVLSSAPAVLAREPALELAKAEDLVAEARSLLAAGRVGEAEAAASRAAEIAPGLEAASGALLEARRELGALLRAELLDPPRRPRLALALRDVALMRLTAAEKYLLGRCDGSRDLAQILQIAPLAELEVLKAVKKFVDARVLTV